MTCEAIHPVPGRSLKHWQNRQLEMQACRSGQRNALSEITCSEVVTDRFFQEGSCGRGEPGTYWDSWGPYWDSWGWRRSGVMLE